MHRRFDSPSKFLEYVQTQYSRSVPFDRSDKTFDHMTREALEQIGAKYSFEHSQVFNPLIDRLTSIVESVLPSSELFTIKRSLAVGTLDRGDFNAMCIKSADGWYAIVINYGVFIYLNMFFKLHDAIRDPQVVAYCDQGHPEDLGSTQYAKYLDHLIEQYQLYGVPHGPKIKLNREATLSHSMCLLASELFILGHEIGHFLNGDLEDENSLVPLPKVPEVRMLVQDQDRDKEFRADIRGYGLLIDGLKAQLPHFAQAGFLLSVLMTLMDALYFVTLDKGSSHPTSIERTVGIAKHFYGDRIADLAARSFDDPAMMNQLFRELRVRG